MKREKTVVEKAADISDTKKQEMITVMMREQTSMAMKINKEQTRQEELVCHYNRNLQTIYTILYSADRISLFYRLLNPVSRYNESNIFFQVRELREKRRRKMEARNEEAAALLGLGARQKTMVEDKKKVS